MRDFSSILIPHLCMAVVLVFVSGCCGMVGSVDTRDPLPTLPPVVGPSIVTATPKSTRSTVEPTADPGSITERMIVSADGEGVYVRSKPDMAAKIKVWPDGSEMIVLSAEGEWCRVKAPDGYIGYVPTQYLKPVRGAPTVVSATQATATPTP